MQINFDAVIGDLKGNAIKDGDKDLTLTMVCCAALLTPNPQDSIKATEKVDRFKLAMKADAGGTQELTPEEVVMLKDLIGKLYPPLIVGRTYELLN